jgi:hypothetical protein
VSFALGRELGRGALGRVVALESADGRSLAGKILHPSHRLDARARARFAAEAAILRGLAHPNLVEVHGLEAIDGEEVLVMERVDGDDLAALIARDGPLPLPRLAAIGRGIADGLAAAHRAGLVHRDLKPHNVLIAPGDVAKVADFGMARTASFAGVAIGGPAVVGTPDYLAPEAIDPLAVDARADLYALGCVLCEMATGAPPYSAPTAFALLEAHREAPLPALPDVEPRLARLIRWLLAKSPADRPQSAPAVARALDELVAGASTALVPLASAAAGICARCDAPLVAAVPVCFSCGVAQPRLEPGRHTVFVTGPGELASKLDPALRARLTGWLRANPSLGLEPGPLARRLPRLPFPLVTRVSESTADALVAALASLGLEGCAVRGGRFAHRPLRLKAWKLSGRIAAIVGTSGLIFANRLIATVPAVLLTLPLIAIGGGWFTAGRVTTRRRAVALLSPPGLEAPLDRVAGVLPAMSERRHRESLRAVVQRAVELAERDAVRRDRELQAELARLVDLAIVAATRVDELEAALGSADLQSADPGTRGRLRDRDRWATRLLEVAAFLDGFRASQIAAGGGDQRAERLAELGAHIEALEELARL